MTGEFLTDGIDAASAAASAQALIDHQNDIGGREVGRIKRYPQLAKHLARLRGEHSEQDEEWDSALMRLILSQTYRELYSRVLDALDNAEAQVQAALAQAMAELDQAKADLQEMSSRAQTLPDGTKVFRDARGNVRTEDGALVAPDIAAGIEWRGNEPSYEEYRRGRERADQIQRDIDALREYQVGTLGKARDRLDDPDDPPSEEELREILEQIEAEKPVRLQAAAQSSSSPGIDEVITPPAELPPLPQ